MRSYLLKRAHREVNKASLWSLIAHASGPPEREWSTRVNAAFKRFTLNELFLEDTETSFERDMREEYEAIRKTSPRIHIESDGKLAVTGL